MTRTLRHALLAVPLLAIFSGCGASSWFYAELEEPGICKKVENIVMDPTAPGADLVLRFPVSLPANVPLFDTSAGGVVLRLLSVTFDGKANIQDFNSVDSAWISAVSDPLGPNEATTEVIRYDKAPGVTPGLEDFTIGGNSEVDLVPFLDSSGQVLVEARMVGGLPNNNWTADITGCLYTKARINYLDAYGIHF